VELEEEKEKDSNKFPKVIIEDKTYTFSDPLSSTGFGKYIQHGFTCLNNAKIELDNKKNKLVVVSTVDIPKNKEVYVNWNVQLDCSKKTLEKDGSIEPSPVQSALGLTLESDYPKETVQLDCPKETLERDDSIEPSPVQPVQALESPSETVPIIVLPKLEFPVILKSVSESGTNLIINSYGRLRYQYCDKVVVAWNNVISDISGFIKDNWYDDDPEYITNKKLEGVLKSINTHFFNGSLDVITPNIKIRINNSISNDILAVTYSSTPLYANNIMDIEINTDVYYQYKKVEWLFDGVHINNNRELLIHTIAHEVCHVIQNYYLHNNDYFVFSNKGLYGNHHDSIFGNLSHNIFCHPMAATRSNWQRPSPKFKRMSLAQIVSHEDGGFHMYKRR
jgi:hypothetical protein